MDGEKILKVLQQIIYPQCNECSNNINQYLVYTEDELLNCIINHVDKLNIINKYQSYEHVFLENEQKINSSDYIAVITFALYLIKHNGFDVTKSLLIDLCMLIIYLDHNPENSLWAREGIDVFERVMRDYTKILHDSKNKQNSTYMMEVCHFASFLQWNNYFHTGNEIEQMMKHILSTEHPEIGVREDYTLYNNQTYHPTHKDIWKHMVRQVYINGEECYSFFGPKKISNNLTTLDKDDKFFMSNCEECMMEYDKFIDQEKSENEEENFESVNTLKKQNADSVNNDKQNKFSEHIDKIISLRTKINENNSIVKIFMLIFSLLHWGIPILFIMYMYSSG
jgi:hypothetical protein